MTGIYMAALLFLIPCSIQDVRTRTIPVCCLILGGILSLLTTVWMVLSGETTVMRQLFASSPGVSLIALSLVTERQIGMADGICAALLGLLIGNPDIYIVLAVALLLSSLCAGILLVLRRGTRRTRMPWIPFMTAGVIVVLFVR